MAKSIMLQGTASTVGKSILCTALCRIFKQDNYNVYPFKSQNMSLNSGITPNGDEIGRAQIMQSEAAGQIPNANMNPILLKPTSDRKSQIIVLGKVWDNLDANDYYKKKLVLKPIVEKVYSQIEQNNDVVVIEGAGSPAEINLSDVFVNMGMAEIAKSPVILVGDIDKGGVFASLYGTIMLLPENQRKLIKGLIINKFRGSLKLLKSGLKQIEDLVNIPVIGVVPYFKLDLEEEDSVTDFSKFSRYGTLNIGIIKLPYMSNFTDFNSLSLNKNVSLNFIELNQSLENYHIIILPGSKNTIADIKAIKQSGMYDKILFARSNGKYIFGICGGYQMLGNNIKDEYAVETSFTYEKGFAFLPINTIFKHDKQTFLSSGNENIFGTSVKGYEIHMGVSISDKNINQFINIDNKNTDGCYLQDLKVIGTYFHGIFDNGEFTLKYLNTVRKSFGIDEETEIFDYNEHKNKQYDTLADIVRSSLDMDKLYNILKEGV